MSIAFLGCRTPLTATGLSWSALARSRSRSSGGRCSMASPTTVCGAWPSATPTGGHPANAVMSGTAKPQACFAEYRPSCAAAGRPAATEWPRKDLRMLNQQSSPKHVLRLVKAQPATAAVMQPVAPAAAFDSMVHIFRLQTYPLLSDTAAVLVWSWPWTMCCPPTWATTSTSVSPKPAIWQPSLELSTSLPGQWAASSLTSWAGSELGGLQAALRIQRAAAVLL